MTMFNRYSALALLLLCFSLNAHADDVQDANQLFKQREFDKALEKVNIVLITKPKDAQARFLKGLILTAQNKTGDAIAIFLALTEDYPDLPEPYNNLAVLYAGQGQYDKAKIALETAVRNHPGYATAHENLGDIYAKMASKEYERAVQLDPNNSGPQAKLATIRQLLPKNTAHAPTAKSAKAAPSKPAADPAALPATTPASAPAAAPSTRNP